MISRRALLAGALAAPAVARGQGVHGGGRSVLAMAPQANLGSFDRIFTSANITRNHG